jgi:hypothetical protein
MVWYLGARSGDCDACDMGADESVGPDATELAGRWMTIEMEFRLAALIDALVGDALREQ